MVDANWALVAIAAGSAFVQAGINIATNASNARRIAELERKEDQNAEIRTAYREKVEGLLDRVDDLEEEIAGKQGLRTRLHRAEAGVSDLKDKHNDVDGRLQRLGEY